MPPRTERTIERPGCAESAVESRPRSRSMHGMTRKSRGGALSHPFSHRWHKPPLFVVGDLRAVGALGRSARRRLRDDLGNALERELQVLLRVRVADPDVVLANLSEGRARKGAHAAVVEQGVGHLRPVHARATDVREDVESAVWHAATNARNVVEAVDDELASGAELLDHGLDRVLRAVERLDRGHLLKAARAADAVDDQLAERIDERLRQNREAEPPTGHGP